MADFVKCSGEDFESYVAPHTEELEPRPKMPNMFFVWKRQAENLVTVFQHVYGRERGGPMRQTIDLLARWHELDDAQFPFSYCAALWYFCPKDPGSFCIKGGQPLH